MPNITTNHAITYTKISFKTCQRDLKSTLAKQYWQNVFLLLAISLLALKQWHKVGEMEEKRYKFGLKS